MLFLSGLFDLKRLRVRNREKLYSDAVAKIRQAHLWPDMIIEENHQYNHFRRMSDKDGASLSAIQADNQERASFFEQKYSDIFEQLSVPRDTVSSYGFLMCVGERFFFVEMKKRLFIWGYDSNNNRLFSFTKEWFSDLVTKHHTIEVLSLIRNATS